MFENSDYVHYDEDMMTNYRDFEEYLIRNCERMYSKLGDIVGDVFSYEFANGMKVESTLIYGQGLTLKLSGSNGKTRKMQAHKLSRIIFGFERVDFNQDDRKNTT